jgi:hypothetical protein
MSGKSKKVHRIKEPVTLAPSEYANRLKYIYDYVAELDKELHPDTYKTVKRYKLAEAYKPEKVEAILDLALKDPDTSKQWRFTETNLQAFKANVNELYAFFDKFRGSGELVIEQFNVVSSDPKYAVYFDDKPTTRLIEPKEPTPAMKLLNRKPVDEKPVGVIEYAVKDFNGLVEAIRQAEHKNLVLYKIDLPQDVQLVKKTVDRAIKQNDPDLLLELPNADRYVEKLAQTLKLKPYGKNEVWTHFDTYLLQGELGGLVALTGATDSTKGGSLYTNIPDRTLDGVPLPVTDSYQVTLDEITNDPETVGLLVKERRSKAEHGLPIAIQQSLLDVAISDRKPNSLTGLATSDSTLSSLGFAEWVTVNDIQQLLKQAGAYALKPALRYLHENPNGGTVTLQELMLYDARIKGEYDKRKSIAKTTKEQFSNSLRLQLMFRYEIPEKTRNRETKLHYINLIKGTPVIDDDTGLITRIEGLEYGTDLRIHKLLGVIDHKQADFLPSPEAKLLESKIQTLLVKQQKKTVKGEPLVIGVDRLINGVVKTDKNIRVYYSWTAKQLNEFVNLELIGKWHTEAGGQEIKASIPSTKKLYVYPSEIAIKNYRTPEMYKQEKTKKLQANQAEAELQKIRLTELKKAKRQYNNDDDLASELKLTREQLNNLLSKAEPISQELADKVQGVLV